jgi:hypothetical protein
MMRASSSRRWAVPACAGLVAAIASVWLGCNLVPQTLPPSGGGAPDSLGSGNGGAGSGGSSGGGADFAEPADAASLGFASGDGGKPQATGYEGDGGRDVGPGGERDASADTSSTLDASSYPFDAASEAGGESDAGDAESTVRDAGVGCTDAGESADADTPD